MSNEYENEIIKRAYADAWNLWEFCNKMFGTALFL
jgi:hypothetical protein